MPECGCCGKPQFLKGFKRGSTCLRCLKTELAKIKKLATGAPLFISDMRALGFSQADIREEMERRNA